MSNEAKSPISKSPAQVLARRQAIKAMAERGCSAREIARTLGIGKTTVTHFALSEGLVLQVAGRPGNRVSRTAFLAQARELAAQGYTTRQMAERFGMSAENLRSRFKRHGIVVEADKVTGSGHRHNGTDIVTGVRFLVEEAMETDRKALSKLVDQ